MRLLISFEIDIPEPTDKGVDRDGVRQDVSDNIEFQLDEYDIKNLKVEED